MGAGLKLAIARPPGHVGRSKKSNMPLEKGGTRDLGKS
jgi:hypothetical protein